ncbi:MAG TPA: metal ABC transporter substrate-binding protein [Gemmataceae bacterium]|nr:metal ABC transporter substrate-binding protein [Gemmataceae bacterium]
MTRRRAAVMFLVVAAMALASALPGCARSTPVWRNRGGPPRVVVTIPALDNFVRNVGGDHVGVVCLCTTQGPHHYQYNAQDAMLLREADLFFAVGLSLDDKFADPIQRESHNPRLQYVKIGEEKRMKSLLLRFSEPHEHGKEEEHEHEHEHEHGEYDPHIWLGIPQAVAMVEIIRDELKKIDPKNEADYDANAAKYIQKLRELHAYGKEQLKDKKNRKIVAFHESLKYFAASFGVDIVDVIEITPGAEADQAHLVKLAKECKDKDVRVIAVEPQYPQESSAKILKAQKADVQFVVVDPLETADKNDLNEDEKELKAPDWYDKKMRQNLDNLAKGLP